MKDFGYLERGTLIQVGTLLRFGDEVREVVKFRARTPRMSFGRVIHDFIVDTDLLPDKDGQEANEYDKQDLEEMIEQNVLKIYNES